MNTTIQAAEANRSFSRVLRDVQQGMSYVITSHGRPVARIEPVRAESGDGVRSARARLLARLHAQPAMDAGAWSRDELYER
jgi:prevent-host-death family protein